MDHRDLFHKGTKEFKNTFRIRYYLNNVNKPIKVDDSNLIVFDDTNILNENDKEKKILLLRKYLDKPILSDHLFNDKYCYCNQYFEDLNKYMMDYYKENKIDIKKFIFAFGDTTSHKNVPCFVKAKNLKSNDYSVILKLNTYRHIGMLPIIKQFDIPFHSKINKCIWRGAGTGLSGNLQRFELVKKFQNIKNYMIDIKFTSFPQNTPKNYSISDFHLAPTMSIKSMLQYKFLISIEGNDVSTNLKWILLSNSVVLQPLPKKCSWFMEDMLIPFKHFIPLKDDFSDLEEKLNWCMKNLDKCEIISKNATEYMNNFLDESNEKYVTTEVIKNYFNNVVFK